MFTTYIFDPGDLYWQNDLRRGNSRICWSVRSLTIIMCKGVAYVPRPYKGSNLMTVKCMTWIFLQGDGAHVSIWLLQVLYVHFYSRYVDNERKIKESLATVVWVFDLGGYLMIHVAAFVM
ncbi:hypothetical protein RND81_13G017200 [Saponaria officinalis]